jgi:hypothetical protein
MAAAPEKLVYKVLIGLGSINNYFDENRIHLEKQVSKVLADGGHLIGGVSAYNGVAIQAVMMPHTSGGNRKTRSRQSGHRKTRRGNRKY